MSRLRLAVIGAGWIGRKHAERVAASEACTLTGICEVDDRRRVIVEEFGVPIYRDVEELLERERPDGAIVATPNGSHALMGEICAQYGVHVLIEKPVADTLNEARRIIAAADAAGVQVLVGHHRRHNPLVAETRTVIRNGALGRLVAVSMMWALMKPADYYTVDWRLKRPGGGPTLINLIHELDTLRFICGEITQIYAQGSSAVRELEVEDTTSITLSFENGAVGSILASDTATAPWSYEATAGENPHYFHADENCYYFLGTAGSLAFPQMQLWSYADESKRGWQHPLQQKRIEVEPADPLERQLEHFCGVIRGEEPPIVDARDGARSLAAALAVLESMRDQHPVALTGTSV